MDKENKEELDLSEILEFPTDGPGGVSSGVSSQTRPDLTKQEKYVPLTVDSLEDADPLFRLLAEPKLPETRKSDRARLQMQSPNRIHFYWSVKSNPHTVLKKALGGRTGSYVLVARLRNLTTGDEKIFPVDPKGDWWFEVDANCRFQAEIGFYAPNRPYVRIAYSNELATPRKSPSTRTDYTPSFSATADQFAQALDAAGYKKDAFDVALAGDNPETAVRATKRSFEALTGKSIIDQADGFAADLRFALLALAAGYSLEEIRGHIDPSIFTLIEKDLVGVSAKAALNALEENFDVVSDEIEEFEEMGASVFGASKVNFPKRIRRRKFPQSLVPKIDKLKERFFAGSPVKL